MNTRYLVITLSFCLIYTVEGIAKFNSLDCKVLTPEWVDLKECRIKALNRSTNYINLRVTLKRTFNDAQLKFQVLKRERGGWHPFLYDIKIDVCDYFRNPNKYFIPKLFYSYLQQFTNVNHTCPYLANTDIYLNKWLLDENSVIARFPVDLGQYGLHTSWHANKKIFLEINGSLIYS